MINTWNQEWCGLEVHAADRVPLETVCWLPQHCWQLRVPLSQTNHCCHIPATAEAADDPKANFSVLLKLAALFAGWYLANIYFNM